MAKIAKKVFKRRDVEPVWTQETLIEAVKVGSTADNLEILKRAGIVSESGKRTPARKSWGRKPSRTPLAS